MEHASIENALDGVRTLYTKGLAEHGSSSKAVGWNDQASQTLRFEKLAEVIPVDAEHVSVGDWGCGYGAMFQFLADRLGDRLDLYHGCDISPEMIDAARERVTDPRARFTAGDELPEVDYVFVSGTFNVRLAASTDAWRAYVETSLRTLTRAARRGVAFNLLSTYVDWEAEHLYYADPRYFFDFCKRELSRHVSLLHDYPLYEWTMLVRLP